VESTVIALQDAGWKEDLLERRLLVFARRAAGVSMEDIARELGISRRSAYYDWEAIREVLAAAAAPELEETRAKHEARLERIYSLLMAEAAVRLTAGESPVSALREARSTTVSQAELRGAIDRRALVLPATSDAQHELADKSEEELREMVVDDLEAIAELAGVDIDGNGRRNGE
jgi:AcrR family transcriptional regulator